eukprot:CFRG1187T1
MGASIAYHLTLRGVCPVIIEEESIGCAASGKAGGFLAEAWGNGGITEDLHKVSFALHKELAKTLDITSYRPIKVLQVTPGRKQGKSTPLASWLNVMKAHHVLMDTEERCAQVTPLELTEKLMAAAKKGGAKVVHGKVYGLQVTEDIPSGLRHVTAVKVKQSNEDVLFACSKVVAAMGPWSVFIEEWLSVRLPMDGIWSTSLLFKEHTSGESITQKEPFALFCGEDDNKCHIEVYPRPNGDVYVCGCGGSVHMSTADLKAGNLPPAKANQPNPERVKAAVRSISEYAPALLNPLGDSRSCPEESNACMRPCTVDALPVMSKISGSDNGYVCCGHNCWGILWGPVSGKALSELILDGQATCVDLQPFSLDRFNRVLAGS